MTKSDATERGAALLKRMKGKGWKLRVWENFGWHYSVYCKNLSVHSYGEYLERGKESFTALLDSDPTRHDGGYSLWTEHPCPMFHDPNEAVQVQLKYAYKVLADLQKAVTQAADAVNI
jgi:hypothetical protein